MWGAVRTVFKINLGLIAVVVGVMIGRAVPAGSNGKGHWILQAVAIIMTYVCIALSFIPDALQVVPIKPGDGAGQVFVHWFAVIVTTALAPVLASMDSILGALINGFAFWEAWKITRRAPLNLAGPLRVARPSPAFEPPPVPEVVIGG